MAVNPIGGVRNNEHWIRDEGEFERVRRHIGNSPVGLGLVAKPVDYRSSSANAGSKAVVAGLKARSTFSHVQCKRRGDRLIKYDRLVAVAQNSMLQMPH